MASSSPLFLSTSVGKQMVANESRQHHYRRLQSLPHRLGFDLVVRTNQASLWRWSLHLHEFSNSLGLSYRTIFDDNYNDDEEQRFQGLSRRG